MRVLRHPAGTFVAIRLAYLLGTALTLVWVLPSSQATLAYGAYDPVTDYVLGAFAQWDSDWYLAIVDRGYDEQSAAFFPLFPALVYVLGWAIGSNLAAGVLISLAAAAVGAWALVEIAKPYLGEAGAKDTVLLLALYPTAFVFTSAYSEGLFLAFAACSFLAAMRGRPWLAGLLGGLAVGTRLIGLALVPALVVLLRPRTRADLLRIAPVVLLPLMGLVAVTLMYDLMVDDALAFAHAQRFWDRNPSYFGPLQGVWDALAAVPDSLNALTSLPRRVRTGDGAPSTIDVLAMQAAQLALWNLVDLAALAGAVALTVVAYRRLGLAFALYSAGLLAFATSAPEASIRLHSMVRLVMVDFPILMAGASLLGGRPALRTGVLVTLGAVTGVAGVAFARKLWVA